MAKTQQRRFSSADRERLRRTVRGRFPRASDQDINLLLPPEAEIMVSEYPDHITVYGTEGDYPMFFDTDGCGDDIIPTVYALWKVPDLLPVFMLKDDDVHLDVVGGADVMFQGIHTAPEGLPEFSAGELWAVKRNGNSTPIAVGLTTMGWDEAVKAGFCGKALKICHCYPDMLWNNAEKSHLPNGVFLKDFENPGPISAVQISEGTEQLILRMNDVRITDAAEADDLQSSPNGGFVKDDVFENPDPISASEVSEGIEQLMLCLNDVRSTEVAVADDSRAKNCTACRKELSNLEDKLKKQELLIEELNKLKENALQKQENLTEELKEVQADASTKQFVLEAMLDAGRVRIDMYKQEINDLTSQLAEAKYEVSDLRKEIMDGKVQLKRTGIIALTALAMLKTLGTKCILESKENLVENVEVEPHAMVMGNVEVEPQVMVDEDCSLYVGKTFRDVVECRQVLKEWNRREGVEMRFKKNEPGRLTAVCKNNCGWRIHCRAKEGKFKILELDKEHACNRNTGG